MPWVPKNAISSLLLCLKGIMYSYRTKTWKASAEEAIAKLVNENVRVTIISAVDFGKMIIE
jgi:hypothetical protein